MGSEMTFPETSGGCVSVPTHSQMADELSTIPAKGRIAWRQLAAFAGPGFLVAVGYMDPGNWATDIAGGSAYGYTLLSVILLSNLIAIVLQSLAVRLGVGTGLDLAQACSRYFSRRITIALWLLAELAIIACDLAEVLGTAIALQLLFGMPLIWGVVITVLDVFLILALERFGFRKIEAFIFALLVIIGVCFSFELYHADVNLEGAMAGFIPTLDIVSDPGQLFLAIAILGATVMPHNLYLHSSLVKTRIVEHTPHGRSKTLKLATWDSSIALGLAFFINAAILIVAAAVFHAAGRTEVTEIQEAYHLLTPMMGASAASVIFGVALLASGQNSTITGTIAGQIVMEGFLGLRLPIWLRRLVTRLLAIVPAAAAVGYFGDMGATKLLLLSQVVLSLQLPFAVVPLVRFTGSRRIMGELVSPIWLRSLATLIAAVIIALNLILLYNML